MENIFMLFGAVVFFGILVYGVRRRLRNRRDGGSGGGGGKPGVRTEKL